MLFGFFDLIMDIKLIRAMRCVCLKIIPIFIIICSVTIAQDFALKGIVVDKSSKLPVENVNVMVGLFKGAITDKDGKFLIKLRLGKHRIKFSHVGYETMYVEIEQWQPGEREIKVELVPKVVKFKPVEVEASKSKMEYLNYQKFAIEKREIYYSPSIGENDVFRVISFLPGVSTVNEFSNQLFIWGGNFDHTLVSIDWIPVYNTYHLSGLFSFLNSNAIEAVNLYPAGYPVMYDDYLSSVIDIKTSSLSKDRYSFKSGISLSTASFTFSGPVSFLRSKNLGSFLISARRVYLDIIFKDLMGFEKSPYYFYDLMGKYEIVRDKDILSLTSFISKDIFNAFEKGEVRKNPVWGNYGLGMRWFHTFSQENNLAFNLYLSRSFSASDYENENSTITEKLIFDNKITDFGLSGYLKFKLFGHGFKAGFIAKSVNFKYFWLIQGINLWSIFNIFEEDTRKANLQDVFFDYAPNPFWFNSTLQKYSLFFESELRYKKFEILAGVKIINLNYDASFKVSPNLNITFHLSCLLDINFTYGRYFQFATTIKNRTNYIFFAPFSVYLPDAEPPMADHFVIRFVLLNIKPEIELSCYFKSFKNLTISVDDESLYKKVIARAYGLNFNTKYNTGWMSCNFSYTLGFARKKIDDKWFPMYYDQRHSVKFFALIKFSRKWDLGLFWIYNSGMPYTPVIGRYFGAENTAGSYVEILWLNYIYGSENSRYLPDYHRLDLKFTGNFNWGRFNVKPFIQVFNVYNNIRVFKYEFTYYSPTERKEPGSFIIPSIGIEINAEF